MPVYVLTSLFDALCCGVVGVLLLIRSRQQSWVLSLLLFSCSLWMALPWISFIEPDMSPLLLTRCLCVPMMFIPSWFLLYELVTLHRRIWQPYFCTTLLSGVVFSALLTHPQFIYYVYQTPTGIFSAPGPMFFAFIVYFFCVGLYSAAKLAGHYEYQPAIQRSRGKWMMLGFALAGIGAALYFGSLFANRSLGQDLFISASALTLGYAVLRRRLHEIELVTRDGVSTVITAALSAFPLLIGRIFAPIVNNLPFISRFEAISTLLACLSFYALAVALVRYSDRPSTRYLSRLFLFASILNAAFFTWAVPRNDFTVPVLRLTYLLTGCILLSWIDYRRSFFEEKAKAGFSLYKVWRWISYGWLLLAAFSPYVLQSLEYYHTTRRPYAIIPGPLHSGFHLWWTLTYVIAAIWTLRRFWALLGKSHRAAAWALVGSLGAGALTLMSVTSFGLGVLQWPWHISLELITAAGILATLHWQPRSERHPSPATLGILFISTLICCLAGFLLFHGVAWQLVAVFLMAYAMPRIAAPFHDSAQALVDHYLFRKKYSYLNEIQQLGEDIFRFTNLPGLLRRLTEDLAHRTTLSWTGVWLYDLSEARFLLRHAAGRQNAHGDAAALFKLSFKPGDALIQMFTVDHGLLMVAELRTLEQEKELKPESLEHRAIEQMARIELSAVFPLYLGAKVIGFLGLGEKEDLSPFHEGDRATLNKFGRNAERAIGQAYMLYEQSLMFSKLAHDTLNYLQAMGMNMDILRNEYLGPLNDRQKKQLNVAAHQRELIRESLVDLRELERLMVLRMQGTLPMVPFGLKELVEEAVKEVEPRLSAQNVSYSLQVGPMLHAIGEPRAIRRVVDNVLINAIKVTSAEGRVEVRLYQKGDNLVFEVKDGGPGIPEKDQSRVFDPFYQPASSNGISGPAGLGLSVVKEVVALHKGTVHVVSALGFGTTLSVEIPSILRRKEFETLPASTSDLSHNS